MMRNRAGMERIADNSPLRPNSHTSQTQATLNKKPKWDRNRGRWMGKLAYTREVIPQAYAILPAQACRNDDSTNLDFLSARRGLTSNALEPGWVLPPTHRQTAKRDLRSLVPGSEAHLGYTETKQNWNRNRRPRIGKICIHA